MITGSTRRTAHTIVGRWLAGETIEDLALDYPGITEGTISLVIATAADTTATRRRKVLAKLEVGDGPGTGSIRRLPMPCVVGKPRIDEIECPECGDVARGASEFVATVIDERGEPRGVWSPFVYQCPRGHLTLESET